jgi:hypothetical protein
MRKLGSAFWNFFEKRPQPAEAENASVGAIVRLLKSRRGKAEEEEVVPSSRTDDLRDSRPR